MALVVKIPLLMQEIQETWFNPWVRKIPWRKAWQLTPVSLGFPGGWDKESTCNAGDLGSIPGLGRSPGGGHGNPFQYSCLENSHGQRNLTDYSQGGCKESDTAEWLNNNKQKWQPCQFENLPLWTGVAGLSALQWWCAKHRSWHSFEQSIRKNERIESGSTELVKWLPPIFWGGNIERYWPTAWLTTTKRRSVWWRLTLSEHWNFTLKTIWK